MTLPIKKIIKKERITDNYNSKVAHCYFASNTSHYFILNGQMIFRIDAKTYSLKNVTADIAQAKPALNSGFSTIYFVPQKNGDGFRLTTNLGKEFYYFPNAEQLYTDRAFKHTIDGGIKTIDKDAELRSYYLFRNKESKQSSNVSQLLKITYKYNQGGPENKLLEATTSGLKDLAHHRITNVEPITDDRICFSPEVLYFDDTHILISFHPTLADDAPYNVQLLTTKGEVVWTTAIEQVSEQFRLEGVSQVRREIDKFDNPFFVRNGVVRTDSAFYILTNKNNVIEIKSDGKKGLEYNITTK